jgi:hypothetical protein
MDSLHGPLFLSLFTGLAFLGYGWGCLFSQGLIREFERFGLPRYRRFIGITQIVGAIAVMAGPWIAVLGFLGSSGLAIQMGAGLIVRIRIGDGFVQSAQALLFLILNLYLAGGYSMHL